MNDPNGWPSVKCSNCGADEEPCADWCMSVVNLNNVERPALTEGHQHLATREMDESAERVVRPSVNALPDGLGFE